MENKKILLVSHFNYSQSGEIHGPLHSIEDYLLKSKKDFITLSYPLYAGTKSIKRVFLKGKTRENKFGINVKLPLLVKSVVEFFNTVSFCLNNHIDVFVGIDPLNAIAGVFLKKFGRVKKLVYYTVDYADQRFGNSALNFIYHWIDRVSCKNSDYIWNVSSRILQKRKRMGIFKDKLILLPNSPDSEQIKPAPDSQVERERIILISGITHSPTFNATFDAFSILVKKFPETKLVIVGTGPYQDELEEKIKKLNLKKSVILKGQLPHSELIKEIRKSGLGIALYTSDFSWTYYGDSMKAREYLAAGVPVIITSNVSTADDIKNSKSGSIVKVEKKDIYEAMKKIIGSKALYKSMRKNARELAIKTNFADKLRSSFDLLGV